MMLHQDVLMADIDVDQWRNAQGLLLRSAKQCRRLVVIHENGHVLKFRHTHGAPIRGEATSVDDPKQLARELYDANRDVVDFVVVMERDAVDSYFAHVQDSWDIDEDLDDYVRKTYAALDSYADGIVTHPGPARTTLGLQWRTGASHDQVKAAVSALVAPRSTVVLGVEHDGELWTSLVLDFDDDHQITSITTADPTQVDIHGAPETLVERLVTWVEKGGRSVSLALVLEHQAALDLLAAPAEDKATVLVGLVAAARASIGRAPASLATHCLLQRRAR